MGSKKKRLKEDYSSSSSSDGESTDSESTNTRRFSDARATTHARRRRRSKKDKGIKRVLKEIIERLKGVEEVKEDTKEVIERLKGVEELKGDVKEVIERLKGVEELKGDVKEVIERLKGVEELKGDVKEVIERFKGVEELKGDVKEVIECFKGVEELKGDVKEVLERIKGVEELKGDVKELKEDVKGHNEGMKDMKGLNERMNVMEELMNVMEELMKVLKADMKELMKVLKDDMKALKEDNKELLKVDMKELMKVIEEDMKQLKQLIKSTESKIDTIPKQLKMPESQNELLKQLKMLTASQNELLKQFQLQINSPSGDDSAAPRSESSHVQPPRYRLKFPFDVNVEIEKGKIIGTKNHGDNLTIVLYDGDKEIAETDPLAHARIQLFVIDKKFNEDDSKCDWPQQDFDKSIDRTMGDVTDGCFTLDGGVKSHIGATIMRNSANRKVRLGAMVVSPTNERVLEGLSTPFIVRDSKKPAKHRSKKQTMQCRQNTDVLKPPHEPDDPDEPDNEFLRQSPLQPQNDAPVLVGGDRSLPHVDGEASPCNAFPQRTELPFCVGNAEEGLSNPVAAQLNHPANTSVPWTEPSTGQQPLQDQFFPSMMHDISSQNGNGQEQNDPNPNMQHSSTQFEGDISMDMFLEVFGNNRSDDYTKGWDYNTRQHVVQLLWDTMPLLEMRKSLGIVDLPIWDIMEPSESPNICLDNGIIGPLFSVWNTMRCESPNVTVILAVDPEEIRRPDDLPTMRLMSEHYGSLATTVPREVTQTRPNTGVLIRLLQPDDSDQDGGKEVCNSCDDGHGVHRLTPPPRSRSSQTLARAVAAFPRVQIGGCRVAGLGPPPSNMSGVAA